MRQSRLVVEEYIMKFELLMLKCDIVKPEEQIITRYFGGLKKRVSNMVLLHPYWTFNDVRKLALNVEKQQKEVKRTS